MSSGERVGSLPGTRATTEARPGSASKIRASIWTAGSRSAAHSAAGRSGWVGLDVLHRMRSLSSTTTSSAGSETPLVVMLAFIPAHAGGSSRVSVAAPGTAESCGTDHSGNRDGEYRDQRRQQADTVVADGMWRCQGLIVGRTRRL